MISRPAGSRSALGAAIVFALFAGCSGSTDSTGDQSSADFIRFSTNGAQVQLQDQVAAPIAATIAPAGGEFQLNVTGRSAFSASPFTIAEITSTTVRGTFARFFRTSDRLTSAGVGAAEW